MDCYELINLAFFELNFASILLYNLHQNLMKIQLTFELHFIPIFHIGFIQKFMFCAHFFYSHTSAIHSPLVNDTKTFVFHPQFSE